MDSRLAGKSADAPRTSARGAKLERRLNAGQEVDILLRDLRASPEAAARFVSVDGAWTGGGEED